MARDPTGDKQTIIWTNDGFVYWHIYASLGHGELTNDNPIHCIYVSFGPKLLIRNRNVFRLISRIDPW